MKYIPIVRIRAPLAIPVVAALLSAGCWGGAGGKQPTGPTVPTEAPAPSTTAPPDVSTVPAVIDEAYLNAVLKELNRVDGDAMRMIVEAEDLVRPAAERLRTIYLGQELDRQLSQWGEQLVEGFENFRRPPGDKVNSVRRIITKGADCVYMETAEDHRALSTKATTPFTIFIALQPKVMGRDPEGINRTPWMISFSGTSRDQTDPGLNPCVG